MWGWSSGYETEKSRKKNTNGTEMELHLAQQSLPAGGKEQPEEWFQIAVSLFFCSCSWMSCTSTGSCTPCPPGWSCTQPSAPTSGSPACWASLVRSPNLPLVLVLTALGLNLSCGLTTPSLRIHSARPVQVLRGGFKSAVPRREENHQRHPEGEDCSWNCIAMELGFPWDPRNCWWPCAQGALCSRTKALWWKWTRPSRILSLSSAPPKEPPRWMLATSNWLSTVWVCIDPVPDGAVIDWALIDRLIHSLIGALIDGGID